MARAYRKRLIADGRLSGTLEPGPVPLGLSLFAGIIERRLLLNKYVAATTFGEASGIIEELSDRIERLRAECPTNWEPYKEEIETKFTHMRKRWEESWDESSPSQIGG